MGCGGVDVGKAQATKDAEVIICGGFAIELVEGSVVVNGGRGAPVEKVGGSAHDVVSGSYHAFGFFVL